EGMHKVAYAIESGKERRFGADIRAAMSQLEDYRREHASYPVACNAKALSTTLGPRNVVARFGESWFQYCSDGQQYVLAFLAQAATQYRTAYAAPRVAATNELIAAPVAVPRSTGASEAKP